VIAPAPVLPVPAILPPATVTTRGRPCDGDGSTRRIRWVWETTGNQRWHRCGPPATASNTPPNASPGAVGQRPDNMTLEPTNPPRNNGFISIDEVQQAPTTSMAPPSLPPPLPAPPPPNPLGSLRRRASTTLSSGLKRKYTKRSKKPTKEAYTECIINALINANIVLSPAQYQALRGDWVIGSSIQASVASINGAFIICGDQATPDQVRVIRQALEEVAAAT
jgi:hypothetical protein